MLAYGLQPPAKKYFQNAVYSADTRKFAGDIFWATNAIFENIVHLKYSFAFSSDFERIESGSCTQIDGEGKIRRKILFGERTPRLNYHIFEKSIFL